MKYFAPITKWQLWLLWEIPIPNSWNNIMFIQAKKNGQPIKNGSVYQVEKINNLKYNYKLVNYKK